jgi:hypothetical protein
VSVLELTGLESVRSECVSEVKHVVKHVSHRVLLGLEMKIWDRHNNTTGLLGTQNVIFCENLNFQVLY